MLDYNMKFYNRFLSHWLAPVRKYSRNWHYYKQEPKLIIKDSYKLINRGIRLLVLKKRQETPDMEKAKLMRDRDMLANIGGKENKFKKDVIGARDNEHY